MLRGTGLNQLGVRSVEKMLRSHAPHNKNKVRKTTESKYVVVSPTPFEAGGWDAASAKSATEAK